MNFLVIHTHRFGTSTYGVSTDEAITAFINEDNPATDAQLELIKTLDIEFEPDRNESIDIVKFDTGFVNLDGDKVEEPWESYEEFKERAEEMVARLNFDTPTDSEMREAYEIYLGQPEEDPSGNIVLWTEFAISNVVEQQAKDNAEKEVADPLAQHREFFDLVIRPRLIEMAIDSSLPMDMTEIDFYHFEEAARLQLQADGKMEAKNPFAKYIEYKGQEYPTRTFLVQIPDEDEPREITISVQSLSDAMGDGVEMFDTEEARIDSDVYFYVEDEIIKTTFAKEICEKHLDTKVEFKEEIL